MCLLRYHWCEYFSLDELGVFLLKFRPADPGNGIGGATIYVRLTVSTSRSRVLLLLRPAVDATWIPGSVSTLQLPYSVKNNSGLLLAFGQVGARNWDTIGVDESCSYSWDAPGSKASMIRLVVRDAIGQLEAESSCDVTAIHQDDKTFTVRSVPASLQSPPAALPCNYSAAPCSPPLSARTLWPVICCGATLD